jgi:ABC-type sugar transport system substrate-binding protein
MTRKNLVLLNLMVVFVMLVGACSAPASPAPAAPAAAPTQAPAAPAAAAPTEAPAAGAAPTAAAAAPAAGGKKLTIALSIPGLQFPFFVFMEKAVKDEAAKLGDVEIVTLDGQNQVPKQTADLEAAIAQKYDGILVSPITAEGMAPAVKEVVDAKIPVATIDRTVYNVATLAHVGADNVLGGEAQGQAILKLFPNGATIFELQGTPGATPAIDRAKGLHNVIDSHPEIKVACQQTGEFTRDKGLSVTENCLGATPKPDAIVAANDDMALGAAEALKSAKLAIPIIGYDALPETLGMIRDGQIYGTIDQFPGEQSKTALRTLVDFLRNNKSPDKHDIFITPKLITKDNLNDAERVAEVK